jgi:hypothetical protein
VSISSFKVELLWLSIKCRSCNLSTAFNYVCHFSLPEHLSSPMCFSSPFSCVEHHHFRAIEDHALIFLTPRSLKFHNASGRIHMGSLNLVTQKIERKANPERTSSCRRRPFLHRRRSGGRRQGGVGGLRRWGARVR